MAAFIPPDAGVPAAVAIRGKHLWAPPSEYPLEFPVPGAWRSFAESDPEAVDQIEAIARRFGGLTSAAGTDAGEPLYLWADLIAALRKFSVAWTETGAPADPVGVGNARLGIRGWLDVILMTHRRAGGAFEIKSSGHQNKDWALVCLDMHQWWLLSAIADVERLDPMRRCRHCGVWFSLTGHRADAGFCSPAHRSAFHQKRSPKSWFWAEVI